MVGKVYRAPVAATCSSRIHRILNPTFSSCPPVIRLKLSANSGVVSVYAKPTSIGPPKLATPAIEDGWSGARCAEAFIGLAPRGDLRAEFVNRTTGEARNQLYSADVGTVDEIVGPGDEVLPTGRTAVVIRRVVGVVIVPEHESARRANHPVRPSHVEIDALPERDRVRVAGRQSQLGDHRARDRDRRRKIAIHVLE